MTTQIYRKEALERMGSPEQLDQLMAVTSPRGWMALGGIGLLLFIVILWSVLGEVTTTVEGHGVLIRLGGVELVPAPSAGAVAYVAVHIGDTVRQGDALAWLIPRGADDPDRRTPVTSPTAGRILDIAVLPGDIVAEESILLTVEASDCPLEAVVYVPAGDGYRVEAGDPVQIVPATAEKRFARHWQGRVQSAGKYPVTHNDMMRSLQSSEWASSLLAMGPMLEVVAGECPGEKWPSHLYSGTPCQARITVDTQRPIEFVLPILGSRGGD